MSSNFWSKLKKPIFALAPMHDVTDTAFRRLIAEIAKPDVMFTELSRWMGWFIQNLNKDDPLLFAVC
jgi:tRNA-dihydrouridine synthase